MAKLVSHNFEGVYYLGNLRLEHGVPVRVDDPATLAALEAAEVVHTVTLPDGSAQPHPVKRFSFAPAPEATPAAPLPEGESEPAAPVQPPTRSRTAPPAVPAS